MRSVSDKRPAHRRYFIKSESVMEISQTLPRSYSPGSFGLACLLPVGPVMATLDRSALTLLSFATLYALPHCLDPLTGHRTRRMRGDDGDISDTSSILLTGVLRLSLPTPGRACDGHSRSQCSHSALLCYTIRSAPLPRSTDRAPHEADEGR